ncbi:hypothetical protein DH2020_016710 [Rehmannia glutinosa]|uniref:A20-type domain-containing protein n=1 Tax=Rehmannia glutinosa TaxID=99300 RepID=A0ABR0WSN1_REHGL
MESSKETNCRAPEGSVLCINNCGFFGSAATMNMCSKCHKDIILKQQQAKLAASSIENIVSGSSSSIEKGPVFADVKAKSIELKPTSPQPSSNLICPESRNEGEKRARTDKHECPFDYRTAGRDAIAKANPLVKAEKLDKI